MVIGKDLSRLFTLLGFLAGVAAVLIAPTLLGFAQSKVVSLQSSSSLLSMSKPVANPKSTVIPTHHPTQTPSKITDFQDLNAIRQRHHGHHRKRKRPTMKPTPNPTLKQPTPGPMVPQPLSEALSLTLDTLLNRMEKQQWRHTSNVKRNTRNARHHRTHRPTRSPTLKPTPKPTFSPTVSSEHQAFFPYNPLRNSAQCRNAILDREHLNITQLLIDHWPKIVKDSTTNITESLRWIIETTRKRRIVWGRESLNALIHNRDFDWEQMEVITTIKPRNRHWSKVMFYRNLKCASTTIKHWMVHDQLTRPYSVGRDLPVKFSSLHFMMERSKLLYRDQVECGFTFVRHPIDRFLSGYSECESNFLKKIDHASNNNSDELKSYYQSRLKFLNIKADFFNEWNLTQEERIIGIAQRFHAFIDQFLKHGYSSFMELKMGIFRHVSTITSHHSALFVGWPLHFTGKIEHMKKQMIYLAHRIPECNQSFRKDFFNSESFLKKKSIHDEFAFSKQVWRTLLINDKELYQRLVEYYIQDFECYDYSQDHEDWVQQRHFDPSF